MNRKYEGQEPVFRKGDRNLVFGSQEINANLQVFNSKVPVPFFFDQVQADEITVFPPGKE